MNRTTRYRPATTCPASNALRPPVLRRRLNTVGVMVGASESSSRSRRAVGSSSSKSSFEQRGFYSEQFCGSVEFRGVPRFLGVPRSGPVVEEGAEAA
jgi:hypothetical protein